MKVFKYVGTIRECPVQLSRMSADMKQILRFQFRQFISELNDVEKFVFIGKSIRSSVPESKKTS